MEWKWFYILRDELLHPKILILQVSLPEELWNLRAPQGKESTIHFSQESVWKSYYEVTKLL